MTSPYQLAADLRTEGWQVTHVRYINFTMTRNEVFRLQLSQGSPFFVKVFRDDPWGHYLLTEKRQEALEYLTPYLEQKYPFIPPSVTTLTTGMGLLKMYEWDPSFATGQKALLSSSPLPLYQLGKLMGTLHGELNFNNKLDYPILAQKPDYLFGQAIEGLRDQPYFLQLPDFLNHLKNYDTDSFTPNIKNIPDDELDLLIQHTKKWFQNWSQKDDEQYRSQSCLLHGDLHFDNIRFNEKSKNISKIIDWDSMRYDHPLTETLSFCRRLELMDQPGLTEIFVDAYYSALGTTFAREKVEAILLGLRIRRNLLLITGGVIDPEVPSVLELTPGEQKLVEKLVAD